MNNEKILDVSWKTIFKIGMGFFLFYILYLIKDILIWFFFALVISFLFEPAVSFFQKLKISRTLSVVFVYLVFFGLLGLSLYLVIPVFFSEFQQFSQLLPQYFERFAPFLRDMGFKAFENVSTFSEAISNVLQKGSSDVFSAMSLLFGSLTSMLFIISIALFVSLEEKSTESAIKLLAPRKYENYIAFLWERTRSKVSGWFASKILSCLFVSLVFFISLYLFNVKYALSLAVFAGISNFVPIIGPVVSGIVSFVFVGLDSWLKAVFVVVVLTLIHQIEGSIIYPVLSKKFIGLPPVWVLISLAIGGELLGLLGAILAAPLAAAIFEFFRDFLKKERVRSTDLDIKQEMG
jgi:predicted PurR-regulated permease PerM